MFREFHIQAFLPSPSVTGKGAGFLCVLLFGIALLWPGSALAKRHKTQVAALDTVLLAGIDSVIVADTISVLATERLSHSKSFVRMGDMVAERDLLSYTNQLLAMYKTLKGDVRNLDYIYLRCGQSWGSVAYALALQAATKQPTATILMTFDLNANDWERTALQLKAMYRANMQPDYTFGLYLVQQESVWWKKLEEPINWLRFFVED